jgi:hypothetical protein
MFPNSRLSENLALLASIDPVSQAAGTVTTGWVSMGKFARLMALIDVGAFGAAATVDAKLQQATSAAGAGVKDIANKAITQLVAAGGNNRQAAIDLRDDELDVNGGFAYVRLSVTVGAAATLISALLVGASPRNGLASDSNQAGVAQIVP